MVLISLQSTCSLPSDISALYLLMWSKPLIPPKPSPIEFTLSAEQTWEMEQKRKELNLEIIGIFHSHPKGEALPSSTDKKFMQNNPYVWIIYSGINKNFRAFILESDSIEIPIEEK